MITVFEAEYLQRQVHVSPSRGSLERMIAGNNPLKKFLHQLDYAA